MRRPLLLLGLAVVAALALLFQPVRVVGPSMLPTLEPGGLHLTVPLWLRAPERDRLVVFREPDSEVVAVKRVAGLPGERIRLLDGDLFVDGSRHQRQVSGPDDLVPLVDASGGEIARQFNLPEPEEEPSAAGAHHLRQGQAYLRAVPLDGYLAHGGLVQGARPASDLGLAADFELLEADSLLELLVVEGATTFKLTLGAGRCALWEGEEQLASAAVPAGLRRGQLFLGKVDQLLHACLDGRRLFDPVPYAPIEALELIDSAHGPPFEQAGFGGRQVLLQRVRVGRDLFRDPSGTFGCTRELQLADDEYFLLGDNPGSSRDSRHYGPVPRARLLGVVGARLLGAGGG